MKHTDVTTPKVLAYMFAFFLALVVLGLFFVEVPDKNKTQLDMAIMALVSLTGICVGFHVQSSSGSKMKDSLKHTDQEPPARP